eukprot:517448_1
MEFTHQWKSKKYSKPIQSKCIGLLLATYIVTKDKNDINKLHKLFEKYNYNENDLRDEICKGFNQNDENLTIYKILNDELNLESDKRQQIYDILLHEYFNVKDLSVN